MVTLPWPTYYRLKNTDYIRFKNFEIGYNLNGKLLQKYGINNLRVYGSGINLITWDEMKIWDPESTSANGQYYPQARILSVGARVTF